MLWLLSLDMSVESLILQRVKEINYLEQLRVLTTIDAEDC